MVTSSVQLSYLGAGGFYGNSLPLAAAFGWTGFDTLPDVVGELDAREVTDRAVSWLAEAGHEPFFAWVHYWNPHTMYEPPDELFERFYQGDPTSPRPASGDVRVHTLSRSTTTRAWKA